MTLLPIIVLMFWIGCGNDKVAITFQIHAERVQPNQKVYIAFVRPGAPMAGKRIELSQKELGVWQASVRENKGIGLEFRVSKGRRPAEAMDSTGVELPAIHITADRDTAFVLSVQHWRDTVSGPMPISKRRLENNDWKLGLQVGWLYRKGDDAAWAAEEIDESQWTLFKPFARQRQAPVDFFGIHWFRLHVLVDSSIVRMPLSLHIEQQGASEIFLAGRKLYSFGLISASPDSQINHSDLNPHPIVFENSGEHVLTVRYSEHKKSRVRRPGSPMPFGITLGDMNDSITARVNRVRSASIHQLVFSVIPLSFALMHFLLFVFYPRHKNNLFYAISMLGFAILTFASFADQFSTTPIRFLFMLIVMLTSVNVAISFSMLSVYATVYKKIPWPAYSSFAAITVVMLVILFLPRLRGYFLPATYILLTLGIVDMIRLTVASRHSRKSGSWIVTIGFGLTLLIFVYQLGLLSGLLRPVGSIMIVWIYGIPVLAFSLSLYISLHFSQTQKQLQAQFVRVKELSEQTLRQERRAKEEEIQRRLLLADNERKTRELEQARKLQLSMLPRTLPDMPFLDIAVSMRTATEVGGDFYDFFVEDGMLTAAIGDATGHGMKAGAMVAAIKSLFSAYAGKNDLPHTLNHWSEVIRRMNLGNLYMAMSLLRIERKRIVISNAGMPPALLYRRDRGQVEEIVIKGMPLGGAANFSYAQKELAVASGDVLLLLSDGFTELFNENGDMFDERAAGAFLDVAEQSPQAIIKLLNKTCDDWRGSRAQHDDITFVVMQFK